MKALGDYVIIEPINKSDELNKGVDGLVIKTQHEDQPNKGTIRFTGPDVTKVKPGQVVVFDETVPRGFKDNEVGYLFVKEKFVIAILEEE